MTANTHELTEGSALAARKRAAFSVGAFLLAVALHFSAKWLDVNEAVTLLPCLVLAAVATVTLTLPRTVTITIGADGVRIEKWLRRPTFYPFSKIRSATADGRDLALRLENGEEIELHHADDEHRIAQQIEAQLMTYRAGSTPKVTALARNGRALSDWIRDAGAVRESNATFRRSVVPNEQLWRLVEDAAAPVTTRAGAALALRTELDEEGRARLRVAADACAAPHLRVALVAVADADDDTLADALAPLEDQPRTMPIRTMSK